MLFGVSRSISISMGAVHTLENILAQDCMASFASLVEQLAWFLRFAALSLTFVETTAAHNFLTNYTLFLQVYQVSYFRFLTILTNMNESNVK